MLPQPAARDLTTMSLYVLIGQNYKKYYIYHILTVLREKKNHMFNFMGRKGTLNACACDSQFGKLKKWDSINFIEGCEMVTDQVLPIDKLHTVLEVRTNSGTKTIHEERPEY